MEVVGEAADGRSAVERRRAAAGRRRPRHVDARDERADGDARDQTRRPAVTVVALTRHDDAAYVQELLGAGASGYVLKQSPSSELLEAIRAAAERPPVPRHGARRAAGHRHEPTGRAAAARQRSRDRSAAADGARPQQQGDRGQPDVSVKTVEVHKANAMRKLGLHGRIDVVRYAVLQGWLRDA